MNKSVQAIAAKIITVMILKFACSFYAYNVLYLWFQAQEGACKCQNLEQSKKLVQDS